ncbi:hypothetical protein E2C01_073135 [Portunus trituberculatus]|uniref:Uncharacterized protein n=1 Tax=Portunus trituberculatus TaxID=210409 RepID=A0A5B7I4E2_PORTR|nr:hypothetical protein [Portunus trituberculatus]
MAENAETEESGISMVEVLQEEEERQLNAAAVLGAADDTRCTYDQSEELWVVSYLNLSWNLKEAVKVLQQGVKHALQISIYTSYI